MLTIVIPSFNHEEYISECVTAALSIDVASIRIIIIDDGSTDKTVEKVTNLIYAMNVTNVQVISKKNSGLVSSLNLGLSMANTEFFYLVASDDIPVSQGIGKAINYLIENPECQFYIGGGVNFFDEPKGETAIYAHKHEEFFSMSPERRAVDMFVDYPVPLLLQSTVFRTKALKKIEGWDSNLLLDDYPTFVKLLTSFPVLGRDFVFVPESRLIKYRHHGSNSYKKVAKQFFMVRQTVEALAPDGIKHKAVGKALAYYVLVGIRALDFKDVIEMIRGNSFIACIHSLPYMLVILVHKFGFFK